jgi:hypothetical protein
MEQSPPQAAAATAWTVRYMPLFSIYLNEAESVVPPTLPTTIQCSPSPCAPQVENYALHAVTIPSNLEQETLMPEKPGLHHKWSGRGRGASLASNASSFQAP